MLTFSSPASVGTLTLVLVLSLAVGTALGIAGIALKFLGELVFGIASAIAGGGRSSSNSGSKPFKVGVAIRAAIYLVLCITAVVLSVYGYQGYAYLSAVLGGIALPIAITRLFQ